MKKIIKLMLNDQDNSVYAVGEFGVSDIFLYTIRFNADEYVLPIFVVKFDNDKPDVEVPYHSVLLIRREK